MTIALIDYVSGRGADFQQGNTADYTDTAVFESTSNHTHPLEILRHPDCPKPYQSDGQNPPAYVKSVKPKQDDDAPNVWRVAIAWSSKIEQPEEEEDPLARPAKIGTKRVKTTEATLIDGDGLPLLNTAGDLIEGKTRDVSRLVITVQKNLPPGLPRWLDAFADTVNSGPVKIKGRTFDPLTLKFEGPTIPPDEITDNGVAYVPVSFELHHKAETWRENDLNRGFNQLVTRSVKVWTPTTSAAELTETVTQLEAILLDDGEHPTEPQWLDEDGRHLGKTRNRPTSSFSGRCSTRKPTSTNCPSPNLRPAHVKHSPRRRRRRCPGHQRHTGQRRHRRYLHAHHQRQIGQLHRHRRHRRQRNRRPGRRRQRLHDSRIPGNRRRGPYDVSDTDRPHGRHSVHRHRLDH